MDEVLGSPNRSLAITFDEAIPVKLGWNSNHFEFGNWFVAFEGSSPISSSPGFPLMPLF